MTYTVRKGDTLSHIAGRYKISLKQLLQANPKLHPDKIHIGQKIIIPTKSSKKKLPIVPSSVSKKTKKETTKKRSKLSDPIYYTIRKGDTLTRISRIYGISISSLKRINNLKSDTLYIGQKLKVQIPVEVEHKYVFVSKVKKLIDKPRRLRRWKYIVVHHSGTKNGNAKIFNYHHSKVCKMENGLAYHFVIGNGTDSADGQIEVGSRWLKQLQGGHVTDERINQTGIGICLVGNFNKTRPTSRQMASLVELINYLKTKMPRNNLTLQGHREAVPNHTDCPGKRFPMKALHRLFDDKLKRR